MSQRRRKPGEAPLCLTCGRIIVKKSKDSTLSDSRTPGHENYWQINEQAPSEEGWEVEVTCKSTGARLIPRSSWPYRTLNLVAARRPICKPNSIKNQGRSIANEEGYEEDLQAERLRCTHCDGIVIKAGNEAPKRRGPVTRTQTRKTPKKPAAKRKSGKPKARPACKPTAPVPQKKRKVTQKAEYVANNIVLSDCSDSDSDTELLSSDSDTDSSYALPSYKTVVIRAMQRLGRTPNAQYAGKAKPGSLPLEKQQQAEQAKLKEEAALQQQEEEAFKGMVDEQQNKRKEEEQPKQQAEHEEDLQQVQVQVQEQQEEAATLDWQQYGQREGESNVFASSSDDKLTLVWRTNKKMNNN